MFVPSSWSELFLTGMALPPCSAQVCLGEKAELFAVGSSVPRCPLLQRGDRELREVKVCIR